ncbi:MAG: hypothetical protein L3J56_04200, partial [Bacteroidales bacterium]|nr:hypothetical protein [Bacteroidales bacterium]
IFTNIFAKAYTKKEFNSAEVELIVNGKVEVTVPVFMMQETRRFKNTIPASEHAGINLEKPVLIKPGDRVNFNLKMPEGAAVSNSGTLRTGVRFVLSGSGTKGK